MSAESVGGGRPAALAAPRILPIAALLCCGTALAVMAWLGRFARWIADDYGFAIRARHGVIVAALDMYLRGGSGRFASLLISMTGFQWHGTVKWETSILLLGWWLALTALLRQAGQYFDLGDSDEKPLPWLQAAAISSVLLFVTAAGTVSPGQSLYWQAGIPLYTLPLIFMTAAAAGLLAWIRHQPTHASSSSASWLASGAALLAGSVICGCSEIALALFTTVSGGCALALVAGRAPRLRRALPLLLCGLAGAAFAFAVIALAPGTRQRMGWLGPPPSPVLSLFGALRYTVYWYGWVILARPGMLLLALLVPTTLLPRSLPQCEQLAPRAAWRCTLALQASIFAIVAICCLPAAWALSGPPPSRSLIIPQYLLALALAVSGIWLRRALAPRWLSRWNAVALALLLLPALWVVTAMRHSADYAAFASAWDAQDRQLRAAAARERDVAINPLPYDKAIIRGLFEPDAEELAEYYGLEKVRIWENYSQRAVEPWEQEWPGSLWHGHKERIR